MSERENDAEFRELLQRVHDLPRSIEPERDLWPGIQNRLRPGAGKRSRGTFPVVRWVQLAAAAALLAVVAWRLIPRRAAWDVARLAGAPSLGATRLAGVGSFRVGETLATDDSSRVLVTIGVIGRVEVQPGTRLRLLSARASDNRLALDRGSIAAQVDAPPRLFFVETPSGTAIDLGCAYTLSVDSLGVSLLRVTAGYVEFNGQGRRSIVPLGASVATRPGVGPGTPWANDASPELRRALADFDSGKGVVRQILALARAEDALSLWHLVWRVDAADRPAVYDRLAALVPPPADVSRDAALRLDAPTLERYWKRIGRIAWRREVLRAVRDLDPHTGTTRR